MSVLGFDKIKRSCEQYGTPLPEITVTKGTVTILVKPAESYMTVLKQLKKPAIKSADSAESLEISADSHKKIGDKKRTRRFKDLFYIGGK